MASFNKVILVGNLTRDPEPRSTPSGKTVAEITLAINEYRGSGEKREEKVTFVDVTLWERTAEIVCQYLRKGSSLLVEGRLTQDKWQDKETGKNMSKLKVVASAVQLLGPRGANDPAANKPDATDSATATSATVNDDDIPF